MSNKTQRLKYFIRELPGPMSYCKCTNVCSRIEIDHVVPKKLLKRGFNFNIANQDPNNLYKCCLTINRRKGCELFGKHFTMVNTYHTGALARSCLYMYEEYKLPIDKKIVGLWRQLHQNYTPHAFELKRNMLIQENGYKGNYFLDDYEINFENEDEKEYWD